MNIQIYTKYIKGEHLQINRDVCLYKNEGTVTTLSVYLSENDCLKLRILGVLNGCGSRT